MSSTPAMRVEATAPLTPTMRIPSLLMIYLRGSMTSDALWGRDIATGSRFGKSRDAARLLQARGRRVVLPAPGEPSPSPRASKVLQTDPLMVYARLLWSWMFSDRLTHCLGYEPADLTSKLAESLCPMGTVCRVLTAHPRPTARA